MPPANGVCPPSGQMKCAAHPLTRKDRLSLADLLDYPFAGPILPAPFLADLPKAPSNFGILNEAENRFYPRILVETFSTAKRIVLECAAIGASLPSQIEQVLKEGACATLPVEAPWLRLNYGFILKRGRTNALRPPSAPSWRSCASWRRLDRNSRRKPPPAKSANGGLNGTVGRPAAFRSNYAN